MLIKNCVLKSHGSKKMSFTKKCWVQKCWVQNNFVKKDFESKKIWVQKILGPKNFGFNNFFLWGWMKCKIRLTLSQLASWGWRLGVAGLSNISILY